MHQQLRHNDLFREGRKRGSVLEYDDTHTQKYTGKRRTEEEYSYCMRFDLDSTVEKLEDRIRAYAAQ